MSDLISRQAAIDAIKALYEWHDTVTEDRTIDHLKRLPSVQPKRTEIARKTHACDLISRQAAIDAIGTWDKFGADERGRIVRWHEGLVIYVRLRDVFTSIVNLPAAQPEIIRCKDCLHWVRTCGDNQWGLGDCDVFDKHLVMCEGYCAWAERRTDGSD